MNPTQSEAVFGSSPMSDILYSAPDMATRLRATKVSLDVSRLVLSSVVYLGSSKRAKAEGHAAQMKAHTGGGCCSTTHRR